MTLTQPRVSKKDKAVLLLHKISEIVENSKPINDTLFGGNLAVAFYFAHLYETFGEEKYADIAMDRLEKVLTAFNENRSALFGPYFCNGFTGLLYVISLFIEKGLLSAEIKEDTDLLATQLMHGAFAGVDEDYNDFVHGSFGTLYVLAHYAEQFKEYGLVKNFLHKIESRYKDTDNPWIASYAEGEQEKTKVNFSLSHGQTGLLLVLLKAYSGTGYSVDSSNFLKRNIDYVLSFKNDISIEGTNNYFPSVVNTVDGTHKASGRLGWC
ncbi:MAG TPA: lanthionine synthetase LanC family protein, partial [Panacibacter sp.]|nr:lanthionine synthetase LanC family protein [Panacibacter sp.]